MPCRCGTSNSSPNSSAVACERLPTATSVPVREAASPRANVRAIVPVPRMPHRRRCSMSPPFAAIINPGMPLCNVQRRIAQSRNAIPPRPSCARRGGGFAMLLCRVYQTRNRLFSIAPPGLRAGCRQGMRARRDSVLSGAWVGAGTGCRGCRGSVGSAAARSGSRARLKCADTAPVRTPRATALINPVHHSVSGIGADSDITGSNRGGTGQSGMVWVGPPLLPKVPSRGVPPIRLCPPLAEPSRSGKMSRCSPR